MVGEFDAVIGEAKIQRGDAQMIAQSLDFVANLNSGGKIGIAASLAVERLVIAVGDVIKADVMGIEQSGQGCLRSLT